jgi:hypothetical protein
MSINRALHLEAGGSAKITNQEAALGFENAVDLLQYRQRIVKDVQRRIRDYKIEICGFQPHLARVAHLKECPIFQLPRRGGLSGPIDHRARSIHADSVKAIILPEDLQRNQPDAGAHIENHSAVDSESQRPLNEFILNFRWEFECSGVDECIDLLGRFKFRRFDASGMRETG